MLGSEVNPFPIQLLLNYWELCPAVGATALSLNKKSSLTERLDELVREGVTEISAFVPWQIVETDIAHTLPRFLQAAADRKLSVALIITPEVGVHYPNSGLPKDLIRAAAEMAEHCDHAPVVVGLPPNSFALPSFYNPEFGKRYYSFLQKIDGLLGDMGRAQPALVERVKLVVTGSFWKYYRSAYRSSKAAFAGEAGDFSNAASVIFRQRVEQFYAQREFADPSALSANRWKTRAMDEVNRKWFNQQSEDVYRHRTYQMLKKRTPFVDVREIELYTPEADPAFSYSHFLQTLTGGHADLRKLSALIDDAASRCTFASAAIAAPYIHWSGLGGFRTLADSQKQFLILKSLFLIATQGGGILLDERDWFSLSQAFRSRAEAFARLIQAHRLELATQALYLSPHQWSCQGVLWEEFSAQTRHTSRQISSLDALLACREAKLLVVDPQFVFTRESIERLLRWAEAGRVVALPRSTLFTESARRELERVALSARKMEVNFNVPYHLHLVGTGKLAIFEWNPSMTAGEAQPQWKDFMSSLLSLSEIKQVCQVTGEGARAVCLGGNSIFVLNETSQVRTAELVFEQPVAMTNFGASDEAKRDTPMVSSHFEFELAPCGVVALNYDLMEKKPLPVERQVFRQSDVLKGVQDGTEQ